jgi:hypothetical protein
MTSPLDIYKFVQNQGDIGRERKNNMLLGGYASQALTGSPEQQQFAIGEAAKIDPTAGYKMREQADDAGDAMARKVRGAAKYMQSALESKDSARIQGAWNEVRPFATKAAQGKILPEQWDDSLNTGLHELLAKTAYLDEKQDGGTPTGFREAHMKLVAAGYTPGSAEYKAGMETIVGTKARPSSAAISYEKKRGADGVERWVAFDPREVGAHVIGTGETYGSGVGAAGAQAAPQPSGASAGTGAAATRVEIDGVDPQLQQRIANTASLMAQGGFPQEQIDAFVDAQLKQNFAGQRAGASPPATPTPSAAPAFGSRTPEQQLALDEAEKLKAYMNATGAHAERAGAETMARKTAENQVEAAAALPQLIASAEDSLALLDKAINHPGREIATGLSSRLDPQNKLPGNPAYDFNVVMDQIRGQAFLQAYQSLKGGGAITEREGEAATNAIGRLNTAQSEEEFVIALNDLRAVISNGLARARSKARAQSGGGAGAPAAPARAPAPGGIDDLLSKYGAR